MGAMPAPPADPVLVIADLGFSHPDRRILDSFALTLGRGEHALLLGPSGSGKSTLVNLIAGLLTPASGQIHIAGEPMTGIGPAARDDLRRRRIGIVFQTLRLVSALSLGANLTLARRLAGRSPDPAGTDALIDRLGLAGRANARPRELSQGEAQRAAIARALVASPDLLLADEPTSALDDANMAIVADLLVETANSNGSTLLIATHDARLQSRIGRTVRLESAMAGA
jgi:putative ABC transport system ATP-binding protein